jgi:hypothetical protein
MLQIIASNYYSVPNYNSEVLAVQSLNENIKNKLFVASSLAFKLSLHYPTIDHSYVESHIITNRGTPEMYAN